MNTERQSLSEALNLAAAEAKSLQEIVDVAFNMLGASVILADSLHYIIALSADVQKEVGGDVTWSHLVELGLVAPLREGHGVGVMPSDGVALSDSLLLHETKTLTGRLCRMCDIKHEGSVIMKLAITGGACQQAGILALGRSLYLAYFRLRFSEGTGSDDKSQFLLSLLKGENQQPPIPYGGVAGFDLSGPFVAASLSLGRMDRLNLTFSAVTAELKRLLPSAHLSALNNGEFVLLLNISGTGADFWDVLDRYMREHSIILGVSRQFDDIMQAASFHGQANGAAKAAEHFSRFAGIARYDDFSLFMMFDILAKQDHDRSLENPLVDILAKSDDEGKTDYLQTLFCWLLNSKRAPATAAQLSVHRNTLDNRIAKIQELLRPDFDNESFCIGLMYSLYMALRQRGRLEYYRG